MLLGFELLDTTVRIMCYAAPYFCLGECGLEAPYMDIDRCRFTPGIEQIRVKPGLIRERTLQDL